ncbi:hypothetical protein AMTRI_Chr02g221590 [Amborella trichopoda]
MKLSLKINKVVQPIPFSIHVLDNFSKYLLEIKNIFEPTLRVSFANHVCKITYPLNLHLAQVAKFANPRGKMQDVYCPSKMQDATITAPQL